MSDDPAVEIARPRLGVRRVAAMARPLIVSDFATGTDVVLTVPSVPDSRVAGPRFRSGDDAALAGTLVRLFAMPVELRESMGLHGRDWVRSHSNSDTVAEQTMRGYAEVPAARSRK